MGVWSGYRTLKGIPEGELAELGVLGRNTGSQSQQEPFVKLLLSSLTTLRTESSGFEDLEKQRNLFCMDSLPSLRLCTQLSFNTVSCRRHGGP